MLLYLFLVCKKKYIYIEIVQQVKQIQAVKKMNVKEPTKKMCTQCNKLYSNLEQHVKIVHEEHKSIYIIDWRLWK